jgi:hypothetical protein
MFHPGKVIGAARVSYEERFGEAFASRMTRGSWFVVVGAWVMVVALVGMLVTGLAVFTRTGSLPAVYGAMFVGFGVIVVGFILNAVGVALRGASIKGLSGRIIAFAPRVTPDGAARLIRDPHLYERWMAQHPGFVSE